MKTLTSPWLWFLLSIAAAAAGYFWIVLSQPPLPSLEPDNGITTGQLEITSSPTGARIDLDGNGTGRQTPATLTAANGQHTIALTLEGYAVKEQTVTVQRHETTTLFVDLTQ